MSGFHSNGISEPNSDIVTATTSDH